MPYEPKVTICVPTYNYGHFIRQTIEGILAQDFSDYEIIVLDNHSDDMTEEIVKGFHDYRLQYVKNESNIGYVNSVNKGLELSKGEYIIYLSADDIWEKELLSKEMNLFRDHPNLVLVHTAEKWIDGEGKAVGINISNYKKITQGTQAFKDFFRLGWKVSFPTCLMKKVALKKIGGLNPNFGVIADSGLFLRLCLEGDIGYINQCLIRYRIHGETLSTSLLRQGKMLLDQKDLIRIVFDWPETEAIGLREYKSAALRYLIFQTMRMCHMIRMEGGISDVLRTFKNAFKIYPSIIFSPTAWLRIFSSLILPIPVLKWIQKSKNKLVLKRFHDS